MDPSYRQGSTHTHTLTALPLPLSLPVPLLRALLLSLTFSRNNGRANAHLDTSTCTACRCCDGTRKRSPTSIASGLTRLHFRCPFRVNAIQLHWAGSKEEDARVAWPLGVRWSEVGRTTRSKHQRVGAPPTCLRGNGYLNQSVDDTPTHKRTQILISMSDEARTHTHVSSYTCQRTSGCGLQYVLRPSAEMTK